MQSAAVIPTFRLLGVEKGTTLKIFFTSKAFQGIRDALCDGSSASDKVATAGEKELVFYGR